MSYQPRKIAVVETKIRLKTKIRLEIRSGTWPGGEVDAQMPIYRLQPARFFEYAEDRGTDYGQDESRVVAWRRGVAGEV